MAKFNRDLKINSIDFMIGACEYRIKIIREELKKFGDMELKIVPENEREKAIELMKTGQPQKNKLPIPIVQDSQGKISPIPVTFLPSHGHAIPIYEFNAFSTELITCVNYIVDLKLRLCDDHKGGHSRTIGWYMNPKNIDWIKNKGRAHKIIQQNHDWIELSAINKIRDAIVHSYTNEHLSAILTPYRKDNELRVKTDILVPLIVPSLKTPTLIKYCEINLQNLKNFKNSMLKELKVRKSD